MNGRGYSVTMETGPAKLLVLIWKVSLPSLAS